MFNLNPTWFIYVLVLLSFTSTRGQINPTRPSTLNDTLQKGKLKLWYTTPAKKWASEALPIGNAFLGGMIFGGIDKEQIQYNEKTLWTGGPGAWSGYKGGNNDSASIYLPEIRARIAKHDYKGAEGLMAKHMLGNPEAFGEYQNFGNMFFDFSPVIDAGKVTGYLRELDIEDGVARVKLDYNGTTYLREFFCSYPDRVMVIRFTASKPSLLTFNVIADCAQPASSITVNGYDKSIVTKGKVGDNKMKFESLIKVVNTGGAVSSEAGSLKISNADAVTILMTAATDYVNVYPTYTGANPHDTVVVKMKSACQKDYHTLLKNHQQDYRQLFGRVKLNLGERLPVIPTDELIRKYASTKDQALETLMFQYGRYLLITSSRAGTLPANLQGVWNNSNTPAWRGDYHFDINIQMNYFASEVTNLTECSVPLVDYINSLRAPGRVTAEKHHGVIGGGWVVHPMNNPFGFTAPGWETYWGWAPFNAAWICQNLWDKYKFTGDVDYLRKHIYPIIREQAQFWQKWLTTDSSGYLISSPSVSPEHLPITEAPTSDESMCYELFSDVIEASRILNTDVVLRKDLVAKRAKLLPLKIGKWGQLQEWKYDWDKPNDEHRHVSHLVSVYQGERINPFTNPSFANAAKISLAARDAVKGDVQGWSLTQRMGLWARLGEPERAYKLFNYLLTHHITQNLFTLTGNVFQIDANLGVPGMMAEMLVQSHMDNIHILPSIPEAWQTGSVTGLCARGGFEVDINWNYSRLTEAVITSKLGNRCTIKYNLLIGKFTLLDELGNAIKYTRNRNNNTITFKTIKGKKYLLKIKV